LFLGFIHDKLQSTQPREAQMSFFDRLIDTPTYQAQSLARTTGAPQAAIPPTMPMSGQTNFAKGGLAAANSKIEEQQIMKVIANYFQNNGIPLDKAMPAVQKEIAAGLKLVPFESSVMGMKMLGDGVAQIHFFTVGTMEDLINDMQYFYKYLKSKGINTVYDSMPAPITVGMFQKLGAKAEKSDNPKYQYKAKI
jgi:hypothetical protein